jgi:hypothetical protein
MFVLQIKYFFVLKESSTYFSVFWHLRVLIALILLSLMWSYALAIDPCYSIIILNISPESLKGLKKKKQLTIFFVLKASNN